MAGDDDSPNGEPVEIGGFYNPTLNKLCNGTDQQRLKALDDLKKKIVIRTLVIGVVGGMLISKYVFKR